MWKVKYVVSKSSSGKSIKLGTLKIVGDDDSKRIYIYCLWIWKREGDKFIKKFNPFKTKSFDKTKYKGDERLAKYLFKKFVPIFGFGTYTLLRNFGGKKGGKSVFYGFIGPRFFMRDKRDNILLMNGTGLAPHLTSTIPIGVKHEYQS